MKREQQPKICVVIRKRPLNKKEQLRNQNDIISVRNEETVIVSEYKQKVDLTKYIEESIFNFDYAFDESSHNEQIYNKAVSPLVESAFQGARVTCFAYGQTGSGKTYTMNGDIQNGVAGLYVLGARDIFGLLRQSNMKLKVFVSFFQIYCGKLFDLLNNRNQLKLRQDNKQNVHIVGLQQSQLFSPEEFMKVIEYGGTFRVTSQNSTNADSSRSHAILQISLKQGKKIFGKISFIDLAGCERGADHMNQNKQTRIDGAQINKSLLALKECIRALDQGKGHTPFRGSKLTMVLKDSFVGFCKTVMIGNISPGLNSCQNTLNTLRYADRVKQLKRTGGGQQMSKQDQLAKQLMLPRMNKNAVKISIENGDDAQDIQNKKMEAHKKILGVKNTPNSKGQYSNNTSYTNNNNPYKLNQIKIEQKRSQSMTPKTGVTNSIGSIKLRNYPGSPMAASKFNNVQSQSPGKNFNKTFQTKNSVNVPQTSRNQQPTKFHNIFNNNTTTNRPSLTLQRTSSVSESNNKNFVSASIFSNQNNIQNGGLFQNNFILNQKPKQPNFDWNSAVQQFRNWQPHNQDQMNYFKQTHNLMINKLMQQEDFITSEHSMTINREIEVIKGEMKFIGEIENNKGSYESIQYVQFMEDMIDSKLSFLLDLKKKVNNFKQKLIEHQQCEEKIFMAGEQLGELGQQQLLDDDM